MAKTTSKITVVFYKDQELCNQREYPLRGWLYPAGVSLKGVQPIVYNDRGELAEAINSYRDKVSKLYFNIADNSSAVEEF